jgi:hypothetical protein
MERWCVNQATGFDSWTVQITSVVIDHATLSTVICTVLLQKLLVPCESEGNYYRLNYMTACPEMMRWMNCVLAYCRDPK